MAVAAAPNHYELAFESWLIDNSVKYTAVDQHKRTAFGRCKIKSFDFLLYPDGSKPIIAEVKGKKFHGNSLTKLTGLECWILLDDITGLMKWQQVFGPSYDIVFIFAYHFEKIDVETDGRQIYEFGNQRYLFLAVRFEDYRCFMKVRSPKWQTVTLGADDFRRFVMPAEKLLKRDS